MVSFTAMLAVLLTTSALFNWTPAIVDWGEVHSHTHSAALFSFPHWWCIEGCAHTDDTTGDTTDDDTTDGTTNDTQMTHR